ncbi:hypothetical protein GEMRC1_012638 [Eukaryota sp. GEM-RC1]
MARLTFSSNIRDALIILIILVAFWFTLSKRMELSLTLQYQIPTFSSKGGIISKYNNKLPPPIISKLDNERNYLIKVSAEPALLIYDLTTKSSPYNPRSPKVKPKHPSPIAKVSLLSKDTSSPSAFPVALAAGNLYTESRPQNLSTTPPSHQIISIVFEDFSVQTFDSSLKLLWSAPLYHDQEDALHDLLYFDATLVIVPQRIQVKDVGAVIVGISPKKKTHQERDNDFAPFDEELLPHHDYFAFDGLTGAHRWCHVSSDDVSLSHSTLDWWNVDERTTASAVSHGHHQTENDWRVFRTSVLDVLPFQYTTSQDSSMTSNFFITDEKLLEEVARNPRINAMKEKISQEVFSPFISVEEQRQRYLARLLQEQFKEDLVYDNVVVARWSNGIEVIHLYSGKVLTHLILPSSNVYCDLNNDGIIEKIEVGYLPLDHDSELMFSPRCKVSVVQLSSSGRSIFEGSICHVHDDFSDLIIPRSPAANHHHHHEGQGSGNRKGKKSNTQFADEPHDLIIDASMPLIDQESHQMIFSTSDGLLTAYSIDGYLLWQSHNGAPWSVILSEYNPHEEALTPSILKFSISSKFDGYLSYSESAVHLASTHGDHLAEIHPRSGSLQSKPIIDDVMNTRSNALILSTQKSILVYSFNLHHQANVMARSLLITVALAAIIVFVSLSNSFKGVRVEDLVVEKEEQRTSL